MVVSDECAHHVARPAVVHTDTEYRSEFPFGPEPSNLYYIGGNHAENWSTAVHYHDHYGLVYLDSGHSPYKIDKTLYGIHEGELLVTKPGEVHFGLAGEQAPFKLFYIGFTLERMPILHNEFYRIGLGRVAKDANGRIKSFHGQTVCVIKDDRTDTALIPSSAARPAIDPPAVSTVSVLPPA